MRHTKADKVALILCLIAMTILGCVIVYKSPDTRINTIETDVKKTAPEVDTTEAETKQNFQEVVQK